MSHAQFLGQQGQIAVIHLGGSFSNIILSVAVTSDVIGSDRLFVIMGHKLSSLCISGDDDDNNDDSFQEVQRRKTRDGGGDRARRKSSGLSRYSNDFQHTIEEPLKIAAFNVRRFGAAKMKQNVVVDILVKIIKQFDIIIVQEVVDSSEKAVHDLLEAVNSSDDKYQMVLSPRLGRNTQKEQYLIIFRLMYFSSRDSDTTTSVVRLYVCMSICLSVCHQNPIHLSNKSPF